MGYDQTYHIQLEFETAADRDAALAAVEAAAAEVRGDGVAPRAEYVADDLRTLVKIMREQSMSRKLELGWEEGRLVCAFLVPAFLAAQPWRPTGYCLIHGENRDDTTELVCRGGTLTFQTYKRVVSSRYPVAGPLPPGTELRRAVGEDRRLDDAFPNDLGSVKDLCLKLQRRADEAYAARRARRPARGRKAQSRVGDAAPSTAEVVP